MLCPECLSDDVEVTEFDFGICPQTGYHDAGERFHCRACEAAGDVDDLLGAQRENLVPSRLSGLAIGKDRRPCET